MIKSRRPNISSNFSNRLKSISAGNRGSNAFSRDDTRQFRNQNDEEEHLQRRFHAYDTNMDDDDQDFYGIGTGRKSTASDGSQTKHSNVQQNAGSYPGHRDDFHQQAYTQISSSHRNGNESHHRRPQVAEAGPSSMQQSLQRFQAQSASQRNFAIMEETNEEEEFEFEDEYEEQVSPSPAAIQQIQHHRNAAAQIAATSAPVRFSAPQAFEAIQHDFALNAEGDCLAPLPVNKLPRQFQSLFSFTHFNKAQTIAFRDLYSSDKNVVVTAPTGAGKTVMFELAFMRMLNMDREAKAVYLAPTKALCSERYNDWSERLARIGCKVLLMTSDTDTKLSAAQACSLIVATPEKWDLLTRTHSTSNSKTLRLVRLLLIDEVHILREMRRGACMEVLVSRMKAFSDDIRFVAVSATIPNAVDVSTWIGKRENGPQIISGPGVGEIDESSQLYTFSENFRPCPLKKFVYGYRNPGKDQWAFDRELNNRLIGILDAHLDDKAALIFCPTRKSCNVSAQSLATQHRQLVESNTKAPWTILDGRPEIDFEDPQLQELYACGIGFHHAGLCTQDRRAIEFCFLQGHLKILCCTSSLAVGVNLPAFLVVIRGTALYDGSAWRDYKDLDVLQMMGRAGRPQYDTEGVCVIMTEQQHKGKWTDLVRGETVVESTLHHNLVEHVNAEIYIRFGASAREMQAWLSKTFFFVRLCKMPEHYRLPGCEEVDDATEAIGITIRRIMKELDQHGLIEDYDEEDTNKVVVCSVFGAIMAKTGVRFETMQALLQVKDDATLQSLVETISVAKEYDSILLRSGEKDLYNGISKDGIPFPPDQISEVYDKISLLLQAKLAGIDIDIVLKKQGQQLALNPRQDLNLVLEHAPNILRALLQVVVEKKYGMATKNAFQLLRCVNATAWEGTAAELRQVHGIGSVIMTTLRDAGFHSLAGFRGAKIERLTMLLNKTPDAVKKMLNDAKRFPRFQVSVEETPKRAIAGKGVETNIKVAIDLQHTKPERKSLLTKCSAKNPWKWCILIRTSIAENQVCGYSGGKMKDLIEEPIVVEETLLLTDPNEEILVLVACLDVAGCVIESRTRTSWPAKKFPKIAREVQTSDSIDSDLDALPIVNAKVTVREADKKVEPMKAKKGEPTKTKQAEPIKAKKQPKLASSSKSTSNVLREIQAIERGSTVENSPASEERDVSDLEEEEENRRIIKKKAVNKPTKSKSSPKKKEESKPRVNKSYEEKKKDKERLDKGKEAMLAKIERTVKKKREEAEESKKKKKRQLEAASQAAKRARSEKDRSMDRDSMEDRESMDAMMMGAADAMEQCEMEQHMSDSDDTNVWRAEAEDSDEEDQEASKSRKKYRSVDWNFNVAEADKRAAEQAAEVVASRPKPRPKSKSRSNTSNMTAKGSTKSKKTKAAPAKERYYVTIDDSGSEEEIGGASSKRIENRMEPYEDIQEHERAQAQEQCFEPEGETWTADPADFGDDGCVEDFDQYIDYHEEVVPQEEESNDERYRHGSEENAIPMQEDDHFEDAPSYALDFNTMSQEDVHPPSSQLRNSEHNWYSTAHDLRLPEVDPSAAMSECEDGLEQLLFDFD